MLFLFSLRADEVSISERHFDQEALAEYRSDKAFDYSTEYAQSDAWVTMLMIFIFQKLADLFRVTEVHTLFPIIFRIFVFILIGGLLYFLIKNKYGGLFVRESQPVLSPIVAVDGEYAVDYDQLVARSLQKEAYDLAIRYQFLSTLHHLHDLNSVKITTWKAPMDYMKELKAEKQSGFRELVNVFESTWYGDYPADEGVYERVKSLSNKMLE